MKTEDSLKKVKYKVAAFYEFLSILDKDILLFKEDLSEFAENKK